MSTVHITLYPSSTFSFSAFTPRIVPVYGSPCVEIRSFGCLVVGRSFGWILDIRDILDIQDVFNLSPPLSPSPSAPLSACVGKEESGDGDMEIHIRCELISVNVDCGRNNPTRWMNLQQFVPYFLQVSRL